MGERMQLYVIDKDNDDTKIYAYHDQWMWGERAVKYFGNLIKILKATDFENMFRDTQPYIRAIMSVRWHYPTGKTKKYYFHRFTIEDMAYTPRNADSNYGCMILDMRGKKSKWTIAFYNTEGEYLKLKEWIKYCERNKKLDFKQMNGFNILNKMDKMQDPEEVYDWVCKFMEEKENE